MVGRQFFIRIFPGITAGQCNHTDNTRIGNQFRIGVGNIRNGQLKHQLGIFWQFGQMFHNNFFQNFFGFRLVRTVNIHFRFDNGNQPGRSNLQADFKLLVYDFFDTGFRRFFNNAAHFRTEDVPLITGPGQCFIQAGNRFHQLYAVIQIRKSFVNFQDRNDSLYVPQIIGRKLIFNFTVHCIFK